jgi:hypothetical protein
MVSSVLYLALGNNAVSFLLDDRRLKSSHDSLDQCQQRRKETQWPDVWSEALASSKTFLRPFWVSAEHSTYLTAPSSRARRSPCSGPTGRCFCRCSFSITCGSSRRSTWVPTIRHGTPGQWWCTSGNHFSFTFSKDAGEVTLKQTRKTSVCGYDSGRRRS